MEKWIVASLGLSQLALAQQKGHAQAELLVASSTYQAGQPVQAALRLTYEAGWHGYWENPGEGGMKTEIEWDLPDGWSAGPLQFPVPKHEITGGLACYGYAGTVVIPVTLTSSAADKAAVSLKGKVSWLACTDKECSAGDAEISVNLQPGTALATDHAKVIQSALNALPRVDETLHLEVKNLEKQWELSVIASADVDLEEAEIFPVTEQVLDPQKPITLKKMKGSYVAVVTKNEYAPKELKQLELIIAAKSKKSWRVVWQNKP